jgi:hypothetical protein
MVELVKAYHELTEEIDKSEGVEHWSDGLRYMVEYLFPVKTKPSATRGFNF